MPNAVPPADTDYDAIEAAVMETARGRWFLAEFARRRRHADTGMLLDAMARLEGVIRSESVAAAERLRFGLVDMASAIARAKADIADLKPEGEAGRIEEATEELDSVVSATETATGDILAAAEQIQEVAWTLREKQPEASSYCDALDALATDIYTACSFQDLTGQRTRKVIGVLRYLESRIDAMIDLWGRPDAEPDGSAPDDGRGLLNGPSRPGHGLDQSDVDEMLADVVAVRARPRSQADRLTSAAPTLASLEDEDIVWIDPASDDAGADTSVAPAHASTPSGEDPLAPLSGISPEQRIALFT